MTGTQELLEIRGLAREFAQAELRPHLERWDAAGGADADVAGKIAELGFYGMLVPESAGGMGFDVATWLTALEQLAWGDAGVALAVTQSVIAADLLARFGGDDETLAALAAGSVIGCLAVASADAGAVDATQSDGAWKFTGTRRWVTNAPNAGLAVVLAGTGSEHALFALPRESGWTSGARAMTMGLRTVPVTDIVLDGAQAEAAARLSWSGTDVHDAIDPLGALSAAAIAVGIAQAALEHAVQYAGVREQFGRPIRTFEGIQHKLAEMATRTTAARALVERAAAAPDDVAAAAMAKLSAGVCAMYVTTEAVQIYGGYGYMRDYPVEKLMRDAKAMEMLHGTSELQRLRIAQSLYAD